MPNHEIVYPQEAVYGTIGIGVRRIQEWLNLQRFGTSIDAEFGPATKAALKLFQDKMNLPSTGELDEKTWAALIGPLLRAQTFKVPTADFPTAVVAIARAHLEQEPREVGGDNRGPWVRTYCKGLDGPQIAWCQGFASSIYEQASHSLGVPTPFPLYEGEVFSLYVPWMVTSARKAGRFVFSADAGKVMPGSMFFLKGDQRYTHVGIVTKMDGDVFYTIEGNTNDDGSTNGYEVCARVRKVTSCDYGLAASAAEVPIA